MICEFKGKAMRIITIIFFLFLFGCAARTTPPAPIVDGITQFTAQKVQNTTNTPTAPVSKKNSEIASATTITKLSPPPSSHKTTVVESEEAETSTRESRPVTAKPINNASTITKTPTLIRDGWVMPVQGRIIGKYSQAKKGIEIKAAPGDSIVAASAGKVVYSGNGLKGYGNLIILKHDNGYLTAYALNKVNLVKLGQEVKCGDKIAEVGTNGILHFELRKDGKPINPNYINGK
jgi:lipoprotein NlpD